MSSSESFTTKLTAIRKHLSHFSIRLWWFFLTHGEWEQICQMQFCNCHKCSAYFEMVAARDAGSKVQTYFQICYQHRLVVFTLNGICGWRHFCGLVLIHCLPDKCLFFRIKSIEGDEHISTGDRLRYLTERHIAFSFFPLFFTAVPQRETTEHNKRAIWVDYFKSNSGRKTGHCMQWNVGPA